VVRHALLSWIGVVMAGGGFAGTVRKQQHGGVERRKEKKTRNPGRVASKLRTSEKPARAGEGSTQTPGPTLPPPPRVSVTRQSYTHRPKRSPCNTAAAVVDAVVEVVVVTVVVVVVIVIVGYYRTV